jgi:pimeloyl-ACP methyl ester carboxylesterase
MCARSPRTLLLLHPFPLDRRFWDALRPELQRLGVPIVPNLPGFGDTPRLLDRNDGQRIDAFAQAVLTDCSQVLRGPVTVIGVSMGGYVALALAQRRPDLVDRLVLVDSRARADHEDERQARAALCDRLQAAGSTASAVLQAAMRPRLLSAGAAPQLRAEVDEWVAAADPRSAVDAIRAMAARPDRTEMIRRFDRPLLGLCGADDRGPTPDEMRSEIALARHGRCVVISQAGHLSPLENQQAFLAALDAWWD